MSNHFIFQMDGEFKNEDIDAEVMMTSDSFMLLSEEKKCTVKLSDDESTEDFDIIDHYMDLVKERGLSFYINMSGEWKNAVRNAICQDIVNCKYHVPIHMAQDMFEIIIDEMQTNKPGWISSVAILILTNSFDIDIDIDYIIDVFSDDTNDKVLNELNSNIIQTLINKQEND